MTTYTMPYRTLKHIEDEGIELIADDGLIAGTIVGITPEAQALVGAAPELVEALRALAKSCELHDGEQGYSNVALADARALLASLEG